MTNSAFVSASYCVNPIDDVTEAVKEIEALREALSSLDIEVALDAKTIVVGAWFATLRSGNSSVPNGLRNALNELPVLLAQGDTIETILYDLFSVYIMRDDSEGNHVSQGAGHYAYLVLEQLLPIRSDECIRTANRIWQELVVESQNMSPDDKYRWRLCRSAGMIGVLMQRLNLPETYELLSQLLKHPWSEIRNKGAFYLRDWKSPTLKQQLCDALLLGISDPRAGEYSDHILRSIGKLCDSQDVSMLKDLRGTAIDAIRLEATIKICESK